MSNDISLRVPQIALAANKIKPLNEISQQSHLASLPVQMRLSQLAQWLELKEFPICVIGAHTGSGKSSLVPQICAHTLIGQMAPSSTQHSRRAYSALQVSSTADLDKEYSKMSFVDPTNIIWRRDGPEAHKIPYDLCALNLDRPENDLAEFIFDTPTYPLVVITQPNNMASLSVAQYIARTYEEENILKGKFDYNLNFGYIGHRVALITDQVCLYNKFLAQIVVITDKALVNIMSRQPLLRGVNAIIIDEAHERSLFSDVIMSLSQLLVRRRKECKVIISSATIAVERFLKFMYNLDEVDEQTYKKCYHLVKGTNYSVKVEHHPLPLIEAGGNEELYLREVVIQALFRRITAGSHCENDVLLFCRDKAQVVLLESILHDILNQEHTYLHKKKGKVTFRGYKIPYSQDEQRNIEHYQASCDSLDDLKEHYIKFTTKYAHLSDCARESTQIDICPNFLNWWPVSKLEHDIYITSSINLTDEDENMQIIENPHITENIENIPTQILKTYHCSVAHHQNLFISAITSLTTRVESLKKMVPGTYISLTTRGFILQSDWQLQKMYVGMSQQEINTITREAMLRNDLREAISLIHRKIEVYKRKRAFEQWDKFRDGPAPPRDFDEEQKYGNLEPEDIEKYRQLSIENLSHPKRTLYIADHIAETSITLPEVTLVLDLGRAIVQRFDMHRRITVFEECYISQDRAMQRQGRVGRTRDGTCVKLYEKTALTVKHTIAEIQRVPLDKVVLLLTQMRLNPLKLQLVDPPKRALFLFAVDQLIKYRCIETNSLPPVPPSPNPAIPDASAPERRYTTSLHSSLVADRALNAKHRPRSKRPTDDLKSHFHHYDQFVEISNVAETLNCRALLRTSPPTDNILPTREKMVAEIETLDLTNQADYVVTVKGKLFLNSPFDPDICEWLFAASALDKMSTILPDQPGKVQTLSKNGDGENENLLRTTHKYATNLALSHEIAMLTKQNAYRTTPADTISALRAHIEQFRSDHPTFFESSKGHRRMQHFPVIMSECLLRCAYAQSDLIFIFFLYRLFLFYHQKSCPYYASVLQAKFDDEDSDVPSLEYLLVSNSHVQGQQHDFYQYCLWKQKLAYLQAQKATRSDKINSKEAEEAHLALATEGAHFCQCREYFCATFSLEFAAFETANEAILTTFRVLKAYDDYKAIAFADYRIPHHPVSKDILDRCQNTSRQLTSTLSHLSRVLSFSLFCALPHRISVPLLPRKLVRGIVLAYPWIGKIKGHINEDSAIAYFSAQSATIENGPPAMDSLVSLYINQCGDEYRVDTAHPFLDRHFFSQEMSHALDQSISKLIIRNTGLVVAVGQKVWNYVEKTVKDKTLEDIADQRRKYEELDKVGDRHLSIGKNDNNNQDSTKNLNCLADELKSYEEELGLINEETASLWIRFVGLDVRSTSLGCAVIIRNLKDYRLPCMNFITRQIHCAPALQNPLFTKFILSGERLISVIIDSTFTVRVLEHYDSQSKAHAVQYGYNQQSAMNHRLISNTTTLSPGTQTLLTYNPPKLRRFDQSENITHTSSAHSDPPYEYYPPLSLFSQQQFAMFSSEIIYDPAGTYRIHSLKPHLTLIPAAQTSAQCYSRTKFRSHLHRNRWLSAYAVKIFTRAHSASLLQEHIMEAVQPMTTQQISQNANKSPETQNTDNVSPTNSPKDSENLSHIFTLPLATANEFDNDNSIFSSHYIVHIDFAKLPTPSDIKAQIYISHKQQLILSLLNTAIILMGKIKNTVESTLITAAQSYAQDLYDSFISCTSHATVPGSDPMMNSDGKPQVLITPKHTYYLTEFQNLQRELTAVLSQLKLMSISFSKHNKTFMSLSDEFFAENLKDVVVDMNIFPSELKKQVQYEMDGVDNVNDKHNQQLYKYAHSDLFENVIYQHVNHLLSGIHIHMKHLNNPSTALNTKNTQNFKKNIFGQFPDTLDGFIHAIVDYSFGIIAVNKNDLDMNEDGNITIPKTFNSHKEFIYPLSSTEIMSIIAHYHKFLAINPSYIPSYTIIDNKVASQELVLHEVHIRFIVKLFAPECYKSTIPTSSFSVCYSALSSLPDTKTHDLNKTPSDTLELLDNCVYFFVHSLPIIFKSSNILVCSSIRHTIALSAVLGAMFTNPSIPSLLTLAGDDCGDNSIISIKDSVKNHTFRHIIHKRVSLRECLKETLSRRGTDSKEIISAWGRLLDTQYSNKILRLANDMTQDHENVKNVAPQNNHDTHNINLIKKKFASNSNIDFSLVPPDLRGLIFDHTHKKKCHFYSLKFNHLSKETLNRLLSNPAVQVESKSKHEADLLLRPFEKVQPLNENLRLDITMFDFHTIYLNKLLKLLKSTPKFNVTTKNPLYDQDLQQARDFEDIYVKNNSFFQLAFRAQIDVLLTNNININDLRFPKTWNAKDKHAVTKNMQEISTTLNNLYIAGGNVNDNGKSKLVGDKSAYRRAIGVLSQLLSTSANLPTESGNHEIISAHMSSTKGEIPLDIARVNLVKHYYLASKLVQNMSKCMEDVFSILTSYYFSNEPTSAQPILPQFFPSPQPTFTARYSLHHTVKIVVYHSELFDLDFLLHNALAAHNSTHPEVYIHDIITLQHHKRDSLVFTKFGLPSSSDVVTTEPLYSTTTISAASTDLMSVQQFMKNLKQQTRPTILQLGHKFSDFAYGVAKMFEFSDSLLGIKSSEIWRQLPLNEAIPERRLVVGDLITCAYDSTSSSDLSNLDHTGAIYSGDFGSPDVPLATASNLTTHALFNNKDVTSNIIATTGGGDVILILYGDKARVTEMISTLNSTVEKYASLRKIYDSLSPVLLNSSNATIQIEALIAAADKDGVTITFNRNDAFLQISHSSDLDKVKKYAKRFESLHESFGGFDSRHIFTCSRCGVVKYSDPNDPRIKTTSHKLNQKAHMTVIPKCGHVICAECLFVYVRQCLSKWYSTPEYLVRRNCYKLFTDIVYSISTQHQYQQQQQQNTVEALSIHNSGTVEIDSHRSPGIHNVDRVIVHSLQQHDLHLQAMVVYLNAINAACKSSDIADGGRMDRSVTQNTWDIFNKMFTNEKFVLTCPHYKTKITSSKRLRESLRESAELTQLAREDPINSAFNLNPQYDSTCCGYTISLLELNSMLPYTYWKQILSYILSEYFHPTFLNTAITSYNSLVPNITPKDGIPEDPDSTEEFEESTCNTITTDSSTNYVKLHTLYMKYNEITSIARKLAFKSLNLSQYCFDSGNFFKNHPKTHHNTAQTRADGIYGDLFSEIYCSTGFTKHIEPMSQDRRTSLLNQLHLTDYNANDRAVFALHNVYQYSSNLHPIFLSYFAGSLVRYQGMVKNHFSTTATVIPTPLPRAMSSGHNTAGTTKLPTQQLDFFPHLTHTTPNHQSDFAATMEKQLQEYKELSDQVKTTAGTPGASMAYKAFHEHQFSMNKYIPGERLSICLNSSCQMFSVFRPYYTFCSQCGLGSCNVCLVQNDPLHELVNDCYVYQFIVSSINAQTTAASFVCTEQELAIEYYNTNLLSSQLADFDSIDEFFYHQHMIWRKKINDLILQKTLEWFRNDFPNQNFSQWCNKGKNVPNIPRLFTTNTIMSDSKAFIRFCNGILEFMTNRKTQVSRISNNNRKNPSKDTQYIPLVTDPLITPPDLQLVYNLLVTFFKQFTPIFGYHGTSSNTAVVSILDNGFNPSLRSGQLYGVGEYFSKQLHVASTYSSNTVVLVSLALKYDSSHEGYCFVVNNDITFNSSFVMPVGYFHVVPHEEPVPLSIEPNDDFFALKQASIRMGLSENVKFAPNGFFPLFPHPPALTKRTIRYCDYLRWFWCKTNNHLYHTRLEILTLRAKRLGALIPTELDPCDDDMTFINELTENPNQDKSFNHKIVSFGSPCNQQ